MGCGKPSRIVPTTQNAVSDKANPVDVDAPRPASIVQQPNGNTSVNRRSNIPVKATRPRSTVANDDGSPDRASNSNSLKENQTPPQSPPKPQSKPPSRSSTPKRTNSRSTSHVSNGHARGGGVTSPVGSVSGDIKVQKRPRSRASGDLLNGGDLGRGTGNGTERSKNLLKERNMNGGNGTGDINNNRTLSTRNSKPLLTVPKNASRAAAASTTGGKGGKNSNSSLTSKPPSLELVVVIDPEVEGKTKIPRPRQVSHGVDPRRYIRVARSCEDLRDSGSVSGGSSVTKQKLRKAATTQVGPQENGRVEVPKRPQMKQRPKSMTLLDSPRLGGWEGRSGEAVRV